MKFDNKAFALAAISGLMLATTALNAAESKTAPAEETVMCYGVNACKAQGSCHGKVDSCSGKNNCSAEVSCAGHNSCKGKGLVKMTKKDCLAKKGTVAQG